MAYDPRNPDNGELPDEFCDSLDAYVLGLISIEQMRRRIASMLSHQPECDANMLTAIDAAFQDGHLNGTAYRILITEIDLATSEDEPTEWSEQTHKEHPAQEDSTDSVAGAPAQVEDQAPVVQETADGPPVPKLTNVVDGSTNAPVAHPTTTNADPQLRDRYVLHEKIGTGSMGEVYKALDRKKQDAGAANPWVAVKIISPGFSRHPSALQALRQEAEHGQRLVHPNIIRVFEFDWDTTDRFFITMEWLEGESLVDLLNARRFRPLPIQQAKSIIEGLCHGLTHAHEQGVVHADVKPGNVFVTRAGHVKLLDFGIARVLADQPGAFDPTAIGAHTPAYSSCEVLEGQSPEPSDDVYSVASLAYRLLAGRRVYAGATALQAESGQLEPKPIQTLNAPQWSALKGALAWRRAHRTPNVAQFLAEFSSPAMAAIPIGAEQTRPGTPEPPAGRPLKYGVPAVATILAAIAVVTWWPEPPAEHVTEQPVEQPVEQVAATVNEPAVEHAIAPRIPTLPEAPVAPTETVEPEVDDRPVAVESREEDDNVASVEPTDSQPAPATVVVAEESVDAALAATAAQLTALALAANQRMDQGQLIEPAEDSAREIVASLEAIDTESDELVQTRNRLASLMLLEAMVAIADEKFTVAEQWIADTRALGGPTTIIDRYEDELAKARQAKSTRDSESLGAIFASATPAAIIADSDINYGPITMTMPDPDGTQGMVPSTTHSSTLTMVLPGGPLKPADRTAGGIAMVPQGPPAPTLTPLSQLTFRRYIEPKNPQRRATRDATGWVELRFVVDKSGYTKKVRVIAAEPTDLFDNAAMNAVRKWRFQPYIVDGEPTATESGVRLRFEPE